MKIYAICKYYHYNTSFLTKIDFMDLYESKEKALDKVAEEINKIERSPSNSEDELYRTAKYFTSNDCWKPEYNMLHSDLDKLYGYANVHITIYEVVINE